jgi:hypothetical protein
MITKELDPAGGQPGGVGNSSAGEDAAAKLKESYHVARQWSNPKRPSLSQMGLRALQNLRWQLVELGPSADGFDRAAIEKIEFLLTGYGNNQDARRA